MAEVERFSFTYKEVVEALIKQQGLKDGEWALSIQFGINAVNVGQDSQSIMPAAIVPVINISIEKAETPTNLSVDASTVVYAEVKGDQVKIAATKKKAAKTRSKKKSCS